MTLCAQVAFQLRVRPSCYGVGPETVGAGHRKIDEHFPNAELEWYTKEAGSVFLTGLLVKLN